MSIHNIAHSPEINPIVSLMLLRNATIATMTPGVPYGLIAHGAVVIEGDRIAWTGPETDLPAAYQRDGEDMQGRLITPALIDYHTHVVFGGNRAEEFEMRLNGASYEAVARAGGGIVSTVTATRGASEAALLDDAITRVDALIGEGVTAIEVKSGYGLDRETELKMLRVARRIAQVRRVRVMTSFLGAHAVPAEYQGDPDGYIDGVCIPALQAAHAEGLVDAVNGF